MRVALITGAGGELGSAVARGLLAQGVAVGVNDLLPEKAQRTVEALVEAGGQCVALAGDVTNKAEVSGIIDALTKRWGRLDILVNCAGLTRTGPIHQTTDADWEAMLAVHLKAPFLCTQAAAAVMMPQRYGRIITVVDNGATAFRKGLGAYCVSKAAVLHAMRVAAMEMAQYGITVNSVCPGPTDTDSTRQLAAELGSDSVQGDSGRYVPGVPVGRLIRPEEVARVAAFLAAEEAGGITGSAYFVDGGQASSQGGT